MVVSNLYITLASGARITTYDFTTLQLLWDLILETEVVSLKLQKKWVIATTAGKIWQNGPEGLLMSNATSQNNLSKAGVITTVDGYEAVAWSEGGNILQRWVLDDTYDCDGPLGCQCIHYYCFTDASMLICGYTGAPCIDYANSSSLNTTNTTNLNGTTNSSTTLNTTNNTSTLNTTTNNSSLNTTNTTPNNTSLNSTTTNNTNNNTIVDQNNEDVPPTEEQTNNNQNNMN